MFCSKCGHQLDAAVAFCTACGAPTAGGSATGPAVPPYVPPPPPAQSYDPVPPYPPPPPYAPAQPYTPAPPYAPALPYASWGDRALGYIIDSLFVLGVMILLYAVLGSFFLATVGFSRSNSFGGGMCCLGLILFPVSTLLVGLYNRVYLVSQRGYSIGQGVMKLKVIDAHGRLLSQGTALIRLVVHAAFGLVPLLPLLDLLWPLWDDPYRQTLHDKAVNCYVIYNRDVR